MAPQQRWIWLIYFTFLWIVQIASKEIRVVCYYTNWSVYRPGSAKFSPQNINPYLCTHLIYAFGGFTKENTLKPFDKYQDIEKGGYAKFTGLKTYNKNLKTMLAIGGWNEGSSRFSPMVANAERRKELVKNVVKFLRQNHFDGLDLDWEYPSFRDGGKSRDRDNYALLVQELREEFERESGKTGRTRLLLTMAVPAGIEYINKGYDVPKLMKYLDWMNILSYDYHSAFEPSVNHHAPLYPLEEDNEYNYDTDLNIDYTIKHYLEAGAISEKLVLGIPTYGRSYTLFNPDANEIGAPADGPGEMGDATRENGYLAYYEICESVKDSEWVVVQPNENAMGPYAYKDNQWVGYDDVNIARKKSQYVAEHNLGGIMFWAIDNDDFRGACHNKSYPIIEAAKEALVEALGLTNVITKPTKATKTRGRPRTTTKTPAVKKERTQNSGGRQSSDKPSSRRRIVNRVRGNNKNNVQSSTNVNKSKRRRRPTTPSTTIREEPSFRESGSSLVVTTPSYKTPEPPTTPDPGGDFKCEDEGFYPHPRDCKKYFWCLSGPSELGIIAHQFTCPAGLYFNKAASSCDYTQNVLCNKKRNTTPKPTTTVSTTEAPKPETTKKAEIFNFSTKRPAIKITAATSRTTFYTTTEASEYYDEYEYDDDVDDDEDNSPDNNDSEDPLVIKELLELIKKAGGIEELEKQLHLNSDTTQSEGSTTQSSLSKKLYERVLAKTKLSDSLNARKNSFKYNSINRNSRGPQNGDIAEEGDKKVEKTRPRGARPQYSTISRQRASKVNDEKDVEDEEDEEEEEIDDVKEEKEATVGGKKYITIRRNRPTASTSSTTETSDIEESLTKLGESRSTSTSRSPYVTLKRTRPTTATTEETTITTGKSIRRRPTVDSSNDETTDEVDSSSPNYVVIQRNRPTTTEGSTTKYREIVRGTTAIPGVTEDVEKETEKLEEVLPVQSSTPDTNSITNASDDITNPIVTNINEDTTARVSPSQNTEKQSADLNATQNIDIKPPKLSEPRPFSFNTNVRSSTVKTTTTEKVTPSTTKVSHKPLLRSRPVEAPDSNQHLDVNNNDQNNKVDTVYTRTRSRGSSRFRVPEITTEKIYSQGVYSQGGGGGGSYEEYERLYRPDLSVHISDLSSLTAVDFSLKDITGSSRRLRPRITPAATSSTTTTEKVEATLKTGSRTPPLARKVPDSPTFGSRRRSTFTTTVSTTPVPASISSQITRRTFAPFRKSFTTASPSSTTENDENTSEEVSSEADSGELRTEANGPLIKFKRPLVAKQGFQNNGSAIKFRRPIFPKTTTPNVTSDGNDSSEKIKRPIFKVKEQEDESTLTTRRSLTSTDSDIQPDDEDNSLADTERPILTKSEPNTSEAPVVETTRPIVETTRPVVRTTRPVVKTTRPVVETTRTVIETTRPVVETTRPVVKTTHPVVETTRPVVKTTRPVIETTRPVVETTPPVVETTRPVLNLENIKNDKQVETTSDESSEDVTKAESKSQPEEDENLLISTVSTFVQNDQPNPQENTDDVKSLPEDSDDSSNETDVTNSYVYIRRTSTEQPPVTKMNRKIIKRIRVTTPRTTTIQEDNSSQIVVPIVNPELNNVRQTPIPYSRKVGPVTENTAENVVNSTEDDAEDELDEDENIKLSESNILENSDLNRVNTNAIKDASKKGHRKVIKRIKFTTQPSEVTQESLTENYASKSTTESGVLRTRKIIRKLGSGTTEASTEDNKRKKIIRRLRPKAPTAAGDSEESEEQEEYSKEIARPKISTTTESLKSRIKPFRPNKKLPTKEPTDKLLNKQLPRRLKLFTRRPPTSTERVVTSSFKSTVDPLSIADIIKFNTSNETSEGILGERKLEVYSRSSTEKTADEDGSTENQTVVSTDEERLSRLEIYTRSSTTEENYGYENSTVEINSTLPAKRLKVYTRPLVVDELNNDAPKQFENSTDESLSSLIATEGTTVSTNGDDSFESNEDDSLQVNNESTKSDDNTTKGSLLTKRLKLYTRPPSIEKVPTENVSTTRESDGLTEGPLLETKVESKSETNKTVESLLTKRLKLYTRPPSVENVSTTESDDLTESPLLETKVDSKSESNKTVQSLLTKRLKLYTRPPSVENVSTTESDDLTESPLLLPTLEKNDDSKSDSNKTVETLLAKRLKLYTRPPSTENVSITTQSDELTEDPLLYTTNNDNNSNITEDPLLTERINVLTTEDTQSGDTTENLLLAKRLKLYTRTTTQKPSTEATSEDFFSTESNTEDSTDTSTEDIETTMMNNSDIESYNTTEDNEEVTTTEISDENTTDYDSTETTEITTLEPKPSTPVYVNKIYKTAGARPKLDLKSRLGLKYTTPSSVRSTTKSSTKFEARSRRPPRFKSSTTESIRLVDEPDNDDVGYGTVKPFKKLFVSTDRPKFRINNDGLRDEDEDEDYEEYEDEKEIKPVISSTTGKYYVNTDSFNRSQYSKPTESIEVMNEELVDEDVEEDEDEDFPDSEEKEYEEEDDDDDDVATISRRPFVITSRKPFSTTTDKVSFVTSNTPARTRKINNPYDSSTKRTKTSTRAYRRFTSTTPLTTTQNLTDINFEALNQRNKQLFNKTRKMNTPHSGSASVESNNTISEGNLESNATETTTDTAMYTTDANIAETTISEVTSEAELSTDFETTLANIETTLATTLANIETTMEPTTVPPTIRTTTTEKPTTFYHIFAETESTQSSPTLEEVTTEARKDEHMVERIIEVNRIRHIYDENNTREMNPVLDHIGVVNRVTVIKVVEGNNGTNFSNPEQQKIAISINGPNILTEVLSPSFNDKNTREERKFEIYGDSKVSNSLNQQYSDIINAKNSESAPNQIVIDSKSSVKTITPKPLFSNEVSTIALEGLFMTQTTLKPEHPSTTEYEELLETENSQFVNVKVLHGSPKNAVFIVRPEEDVTMKADVVEISRPITAGLIKIAPISVSFQKKIPNIK